MVYWAHMLVRWFAPFVVALVTALGFGVAGNVAEAKTACSCFCADGSSPIVNISPGNNTCQNDCAAMCGGLARLQGEQIAITVDCVPGVTADCTKDPAFAAYKGVACVLVTGADGDSDGTPDCAEGTNPWCTRYNGQVPTCIVPLTPENANIECRKFGGIASGGTCGFLVEGENPNTYFKSRPTFGGKYGLTEFTQTFSTYSAWESAVTRQIDPATGTFQISPTDGLCYRYGVKYGGAPTYEGFDPGPNGENVVQPVPSSAYVCLEKQTNTCGSITPPTGQSPTLPARSYSCQLEADVVARGQNAGSTCFPMGQGCEASPNLRCCQGGTVFDGCFVDADCASGRNEVCRQGKCVQDLVCDHTPGADAYGTPYGDRRCRTATEAEKATPGVCSNPIIGGFGTCPQQGQACCIPRQPSMVSGCVPDKMLDLNIDQNYADFGCISASDIPDEQRFEGELRGISDEYNYNPNGGMGVSHCLTSQMPVIGPDGRVERTVPRCGGSQVCCNKRALNQFAALESRPRQGSACGTRSGYTCQQVSGVAAGDENLGLSRADFLQELSRGACEITPVEDDYAINTQCENQTICCDASVLNPTLCSNDAQCGGGLKCDLVIGRCIAGDLVNAVRASACVDAARAAAGTEFVNPVVEASGYAESDFSCQFVTQNSEGLVNNCVPQGCEGVTAPNGFAGTAQCCTPGTGLTAAAAANQAALEGNDSVIQAPGGIRLSGCIKTGNCGLEDILFTGAGFANFLLEISGAVFLGIFVYGGFLYLTAGTTDRAAKGKKTIIQASVAMVLILAAFVFVNFVQQSLIGAVVQNEAQASCGADEATANFSCQFLAADPSDSAAVSDEVSRRGCVRNKCPGPDNYLCCPL